MIIAWLFIGLGGLIYHFGPGRERLELDQIDNLLADARASVAAEEWDASVTTYEKVLAMLPDQLQEQSWQVQLELCKAKMMAAKLPEARTSLEELFRDVRAAENAPQQLVADIESALASSQYYTTWLMRLEGLPEDEWKPEIEAARQHYSQRVKEARELGDANQIKIASEDLESAIRLARMDLGELQGLPLPSQ
ncbi:MAG: hypothetical protein R3C03_22635 [Pirellulaceae bacterium]